MRFLQMKWIVPVVILALVYVGDQIRLGRPDHKYRLTLEVETPAGLKSASGVVSVHPNRGYGGTGSGSSGPRTKGDAVVVDLGGSKTLVALLAFGETGSDFEDTSFLAMRAIGAAAENRIVFRDVKTFAGKPPVLVTGTLMPALVTFADATDPRSARRVRDTDLEAALGAGYRLRAATVEVLPTGFWPINVGGVLGEPLTRGIEDKLPWLKTASGAATALQAAEIKTGEGFSPEAAFTRK